MFISPISSYAVANPYPFASQPTFWENITEKIGCNQVHTSRLYTVAALISLISAAGVISAFLGYCTGTTLSAASLSLIHQSLACKICFFAIFIGAFTPAFLIYSLHFKKV